jgi:hypothetical protein
MPAVVRFHNRRSAGEIKAAVDVELGRAGAVEREHRRSPTAGFAEYLGMAESAFARVDPPLAESAITTTLKSKLQYLGDFSGRSAAVSRRRASDLAQGEAVAAASSFVDWGSLASAASTALLSAEAVG